MSVKLRPGVYASYEVKSESKSSAPVAVVGIAAQAASGSAKLILSADEAAENYGDCSLSKLIRSAILSGAERVYAVPVVSDDYAAAMLGLCEKADVGFLCCDAADAATQTAIKTALCGDNNALLYKILVFEGSGEAEDLCERAEGLNCENIMLVGNKSGESGCAAAAMAGLLAAREDPALPVNGEELCSLTELSHEFSDAETELLLSGGVTPIEMRQSKVTVVRGVTTRTTVNGAADASYRDINTVMVINHVLPRIAAMLSRDFKGKRNSAFTKSAICDAVRSELAKMLREELIADYGGVTANESEDDPTVCEVSFTFSAAKGLHIIELHARVDL